MKTNNIYYAELNPIKKIVIYLVFFIAFCGWSSISLNISPWGGGLLVPMFAVILFIYVLFSNNMIRKEEMNPIVGYTLLTAAFSLIPALFEWNSSIVSYAKSYCFLFYGLAFYYMLNIWRVDPRCLIRIITFFCVIWVVLEIVQQFTYPLYWFAGRKESEYTGALENRMGLWRFYIWGVDFVMIAWCVYFTKFLKKAKINSRKNIILALLFAVGLFCYGSRKHIAALLISIVVAFLFGKKRGSKIKFLLVIFGLALVTFIFMDSFMSMNSEISERQGMGDDFIRLLAADYFINNFAESNLYYLFGTGFGSELLTSQIDYAKDTFNFYQADVGIIGYFSQVGIVGVSAIIFYFYRFFKNWKYIDIEYKMFFIMKAIMLFFDFWMMWSVGVVAYGVFLYLLNANIRKNKAISSAVSNTKYISIEKSL